MPAPVVESMPDRIRRVEDASASSLPSRLSLTLAQSSLTPEDLHRASATAARRFAIPPIWFLKPYGAYANETDPANIQLYTDPMTGGPITLDTARRLIRPYTGRAVRGMIQGAAQGTPGTVTPIGAPGGKILGVQTTAPISEVAPHRIGQAFQAMAALPGDLPFSHALAVAADLARHKKLDLDLYGQNLQRITEVSQLPPLQAAAVAKQATLQGKHIQTQSDVLGTVVPQTQGALDHLDLLRRIADGDVPSSNGVVQVGGQLYHVADVRVMLDKGDPASSHYDPTSSEAQVLNGTLSAQGVDLGGAFAWLHDEQTNYVQAAKEIEQSNQVRIPFSDSPVGHVVGTLLKWAGKPLDVAFRVAVTGAAYTPFGALAQGEQELAAHFNLPTTHVDYNALRDLHATLRDSYEIAKIGATETAASTLERDGIPQWATALGELFVGNYIDPLTGKWGLLGRLSDARVERTLVGLSEAGKASEADAKVLAFLDGPMRRFSSFTNVTVPEYLIREADRSESAPQFWARAVDNFRNRFASNGLEPIVAERIKNYADTTRALGLSMEDRVAGVRDLFAGGLGVDTGHLGDLAQQVQVAYDAKALESSQRLTETVPKTDAYKDVATEAQQAERDQQMALAAIGGTQADVMYGAPHMVEIPHMAGPVTRLEFALRNSDAAGTQLGSVVRSTLGDVPRRSGINYTFNFEEPDFAVKDLERAMIQNHYFSPAEIADYRQRFATALDPANPFREFHADALIGKVEELGLEKINLASGISKAQSDQIISSLKTASGWRKGQGAYELDLSEVPTEGKVPGLLKDPVATTQYPNFGQMMDFNLYRRGISEYEGTLKRLMKASRAMLGITSASEARKVMIPMRRWIDIVGHDFLVKDVVNGVMKPLMWVNPRYVTRVVGIDHQARFIGAVGVARRMEAFGPDEAKYLTKFLGGSAAALGGAVAGGAVAGPLGIVPGALLGAVGGVKLLSKLDPLFRKTEDGLRWISDVVDPATGEKVSELLLPRVSRIPGEPLANNALFRLALSGDEPISRQTVQQFDRFARGALTKDDPEFFRWLHHGLANTYGQDPLGNRVLDDVAQGLSADASNARQMQWLTAPGDGQTFAKRMMMEGDFNAIDLAKMNDEVRTMQNAVRYYTGGQADIAAAARDRILTMDQLRNMPDEAKPLYTVGPLSSNTANVRTSYRSFMNSMMDIFAQQPNNLLFNQPFFKSWYDRALRGLVDVASARGETITREAADRISETARQFAISQVRRHALDLTRTQRLDELTSGLFVFLHPAIEFPLVWGRIAKENPAMLGWAFRAGRAALDSGFVKRDPDTGQLEVPMSWFAGAAPLLAAVTGGQLSPTSKGGGWALSAPLASFNLFMQNTVSVPTPGNVAGDIPIPMPSLNPIALFGFQQLVQHSDIKASIKARLSSWLFAYGGVGPESVLPPFLRYAIESMTGSPWTESETNLQATHFLQMQEAMGQTPDPALARRQARSFAGLRAVFSLMFPAAPQIDFPTKPLEEELNNLRLDPGKGGLGYDAGTQEFLRRHPNLFLITQARTMWNATNDSPTRIPANQMVDQLLSTKGVQQFAKEHPEWLWAIIPSELRDGTFDPGSFFAQIARGQVIAKTPEQFLQGADVQNGWDAYFAERDLHQAWTDTHPDIPTTDASYIAENDRHKAAIDALMAQNTPWKLAFDTHSQETRVDPNVMATARQLAANPMFSKTDTGQGLQAYLALRDQISGQLSDANLHTINSTTAANLGLTKAYEDGLAQIEKDHPDFATAYRLFFSADLQNVKTAGERAIDSLGAKYGQNYIDQTITPWESRLEELRAAVDTAAPGLPKEQAYAAIRDFQNQAYAGFPSDANPMTLKWNAYTPSEKTSYLVNELSKPYEFLSRFDKETVLGERSSVKTEKLWSQYDQIRIQITEANNTDPKFDSRAAYQALDAWVTQQAASNKQFAAQVEHANDWTYTFKSEQAHLFPAMGDAQPYWTSFLDAVGQVETVVNTYRDQYGNVGLHGDGPGGDLDPNKQVLYNALRQKLIDYQAALADANPAFAQQWTWLDQQNSSTSLIDSFIPSVWYATGPLALEQQKASA